MNFLKDESAYARHRLAVAARARFKRWMAKQGKTSCEICGWSPPFIRRGGWRMLHANHVIPVSCGGPDDFTNLILLCPNHHTLAGYFMKRSDRSGGRRTYFGPKCREDLISWLKRMDRDPDGWMAEQVLEVQKSLCEG